MHAEFLEYRNTPAPSVQHNGFCIQSIKFFCCAFQRGPGIFHHSYYYILLPHFILPTIQFSFIFRLAPLSHFICLAHIPGYFNDTSVSPCRDKYNFHNKNPCGLSAFLRGYFFSHGPPMPRLCCLGWWQHIQIIEVSPPFRYCSRQGKVRNR